MRRRIPRLVVTCVVLLLAVPAVAEALSWGPSATTRFGGSHGLVACPTAQSCVAVNGGYADAFSPTDPSSARAQVLYTLRGHRALRCPTTTFCVTLGRNYTLATFVPQTPGRQTVTGLPIKATTLACVSTTQCTLAGLSYAGTPMVLTVNPSDPNAVQIGSPGDVPVIPRAIACPSRTQCTIAGVGKVDTFNPRALGTQIPATVPLIPVQAISCPSTTQCTLAGQGDSVVTFNPRSRTASGRDFAITSDTTAGTDAIACHSTTECVAGLSSGAVLEGNPRGVDTWTQVIAAPDAISDVSCPSATVCLAIDARGDLYTAPAPTTTAGTRTVLSTPAVALTGRSRLGTVHQDKDLLTIKLGCAGAKAARCTFILQLAVAHHGAITAGRTITLKPGTRTVSLALGARLDALLTRTGRLGASLAVSQKVFGGTALLDVQKLTLRAAAS